MRAVCLVTIASLRCLHNLYAVDLPCKYFPISEKKFIMKFSISAILSLFIVSVISYADETPSKVFSTCYSTVFHTKDCKELPSNSDLVEFSSVQGAINDGASPCKTCIDIESINLSNLQLHVDTSGNSSDPIATQVNILKQFLSSSIEELHRMDAASDELVSKWELLRKHPQYFEVDRKLKKVEASAFIGGLTKRSALYAVMRKTLSDEEKDVLRKVVELSEQNRSFFKHVQAADKIRFKLYDRFSLIKDTMINEAKEDSSYADNSQYIMLAQELLAQFEVIETIMDRFIEKFSTYEEAMR